MIEAMECDDYKALSDNVFATGYIRKYARLLGLDPEPLLAAYRAPPPRTDDVPPANRESGGNHLIFGPVSLGILILLGVATFLWRQGR